MTVLEKIAEVLAAQPAKDERLALHLLDTVGVWIAGRKSEEAHELGLLKSQQPFAVFGDGVLDELAFRVGMTRLSEMDDIHLPSCTTNGAVVATSALVVAGAVKANAAAFAQALANGYGLMSACGTAICGPAILRRGVWPTYLLAPLGVAAVTSRLLGFSVEKTANALAIALTMTSGGVGDPNGIIPRWMLAGLAARQGCAAAIAASHGFNGDRRLLDGDWLKRVHGIDFDISVFDSPLPGTASLSMKPHCAAKQTMSGTEAFVSIVGRGIDPEDIVSVKAHVLPAFLRMIGHHEASNRTGRLTGLPYQMAVAVYQPANLLDVNRPAIEDDRITQLMHKVEVTADAALDQHFPQLWGSRVEVTTSGGRTETAEVIAAKGDPGCQFTPAEVQAKFNKLAGKALGESQAAALADLCLRSTGDDAALAELCRVTAKISAGTH